jgi:polyisoprenoid-binding protein YceI
VIGAVSEKRMKRVTLLLAITAVSLLAGTAASDAVAAARWVAPEGRSRIGFLLHTFWYGVEGTTTFLDAVMESATGDPLADGVVRVTMEAAALETGVARRDRRMREEHLEVGRYLSIQFLTVAPPRELALRGPGRIDGEAPRFLEVTGDLTLHGVTRRVTARVEAERADDGWLMKGRLTIWLSRYGIPDPSRFFNRVRDDVDIYFEIRLVREPEIPGSINPTP